MNCTLCDNEINIQQGKSTCPNGDRHQVEVKTYYMDDAPADPGPFIDRGQGFVATGENRKHSRTILENVVPEQRITVDGQARTIPGRQVIFIRGLYSTTDAEEQFYLDRREAAGALCTKARWEAVYLTDYQRLELGQMQLAADRQRLEQDQSSLLQRVKGQGQKSAEGSATREVFGDQIPA